LVIDYSDYFDEIVLIEKLKIFFSYDKEQVYQILKYISDVKNDGQTDLESLTLWIFNTDTFKMFKDDKEYVRKLCNTLILTSLLSIDSDSCFVITPLGVTYLCSR
jgi:hypothetical protein